jgi:hypothetical protein
MVENMTIQEYKNQIKEDLMDYAEECKGYCNDMEKFREWAWIADQVTGNGSGSYFCNSYKAQEALGNLIWSEDLADMFREFGYDSVPMEKGPEYIDVSVRCFLLDECINEIEEELEEILFPEEEEEEK